MFSFITNCQPVFQTGCTIFHSHKQWMRVLVLHNLVSIWCFRVLGFGYFNMCEWYFTVVLIYISNNICWASLYMLICHLFGEVSVLISCPFLSCCFSLLSLKSFLSVFDSSPLLHVCFANVVSWTVACFLTHITVTVM